MAKTQRDVMLLYNGQDITNNADIIECVLRDVSCGKAIA